MIDLEYYLEQYFPSVLYQFQASKETDLWKWLKREYSKILKSFEAWFSSLPK